MMITDLRIFPIGYMTGLLNELTWEFEQKCPYMDDREAVNIYMPKILTYVLEEDYRAVMKMHPAIGHYRFKGYKILPGYEYCRIIIAHERYPETNDERYIHSKTITESVELKDKPKKPTPQQLEDMSYHGYQPEE